MTPFDAPTARPNEPVDTGVGTAGTDQGMSAADAARLARYLPAMVEMAQRPDATPQFKNYVRLLRARVG